MSKSEIMPSAISSEPNQPTKNLRQGQKPPAVPYFSIESWLGQMTGFLCQWFMKKNPPNIKLGCIIYTLINQGPEVVDCSPWASTTPPLETRRCLTSVKIFLAKRFIKGAPQVNDAK